MTEEPFGRYRLVELLGRGGMGEVWRAHDTATNRTVAIKVLPPNLATDQSFVERFRREAEMAAQLNNPHIIPIHNYGEIDGRLYVDMRLIEGRDLQAILDAEGPMAPQRAVKIIEHVATALHAAHKAGLVHRDVKPSNILLDENDFAYLIDFGIARGADHTSLTGTGTMIGSMHYMAPERLSGLAADARADIYALTCVLYECLTGARPFPGDTLESQIAGHLTNPPPYPSLADPKVPAGFDAVITKGMAKDPEQRYPTTNELARAAQNATTTPMADPFAASGPVVRDAPMAPTTAAPYDAPPPYGAATQYGAPAHYSTSYPPPPPPPPSSPSLPSHPSMPVATQGTQTNWRPLWILLGVGGVCALLVVIATAAFLLLGRDDSGTTSDAAPTSGTSTRTGAADRPGTFARSAPSVPSAPSTAAPPTSDAPKGPSELQTAEGLTGLLGTIRETFGDTMGFDLVVYPDYAVMTRVSPDNDHVAQDFMYRDGAWSSWGSDSTTSSFDVLGDLSQFDAAAVAAQLASPPPELEITDPSKSYLIVEGAEGGTLELIMHSTLPGTGFMTLNPDGSVKRLHPLS